MQINPEREFNELNDSTQKSLENVNDTYTAPSAGMIYGWIRCAVGQSSGYVNLRSSYLGGGLKCLCHVVGSENFNFVSFPVAKGETITMSAAVNLTSAGFAFYFTKFGE